MAMLRAIGSAAGRQIVEPRRSPLTGFLPQEALHARHSPASGSARSGRRQGALIHCELTGAAAIAATHGLKAEEQIIREASARLGVPSAPRRPCRARGARVLPGVPCRCCRPDGRGGPCPRHHGQPGGGSRGRGAEACLRLPQRHRLAPKDGATAEELLRSAELALAAAREQETPGYGFYDPAFRRSRGAPPGRAARGDGGPCSRLLPARLPAHPPDAFGRAFGLRGPDAP